jgi:hypothetical protein
VRHLLIQDADLKLDLAGWAEGVHCSCRRTSVENSLSDTRGQLLSLGMSRAQMSPRCVLAQPNEEGLLRRSEMFFLSCRLCPEWDEKSQEAWVLSGESYNVLTLDALLRPYGREPPGGPPWQGEKSLVIRVPI